MAERQEEGQCHGRIERNVQIYFSRQDTFWRWAPFLAGDSYEKLVKLTGGCYSAGAD